ncbi:MAG TPA: hypothetical protein VKM55_07940 [Candidatus Lokiarchaeia archaeon]|nr:hypothetical protein [Candidatus Lokiarchaeia archaeon]
MSAGRVILYIIAAGAVLGVTYAFFWAINLINKSFPGIDLQVMTYISLVWLMSGILAGLIIFAAIAKNHGQLEILSSLSFLIFTLFAYIVGCTILSLFMPYSGFGILNVTLVVNLTGFGTINANILYANIVTALLIVILQALRFLKTVAKASKTTKEVAETKGKSR